MNAPAQEAIRLPLPLPDTDTIDLDWRKGSWNRRLMGRMSFRKWNNKSFDLSSAVLLCFAIRTQLALSGWYTTALVRIFHRGSGAGTDMKHAFDRYDNLDLETLVSEWRFWSDQVFKEQKNGLSSDDSKLIAAHLDTLISSKNSAQTYLSLTDKNGETIDWFKADSWA